MMELEDMPLSYAQTKLSNSIYEAARLYEQLERVGKVRGNGHHIRQKLAAIAEDLLADRWIDNEKMD